jgi:hypothetical protein
MSSILIISLILLTPGLIFGLVMLFGAFKKLNLRKFQKIFWVILSVIIFAAAIVLIQALTDQGDVSGGLEIVAPLISVFTSLSLIFLTRSFIGRIKFFQSLVVILIAIIYPLIIWFLSSRLLWDFNIPGWLSSILVYLILPILIWQLLIGYFISYFVNKNKKAELNTQQTA